MSKRRFLGWGLILAASAQLLAGCGGDTDQVAVPLIPVPVPPPPPPFANGISRVSVGSDGQPGNGPSLFSVLSANGEIVAFESSGNAFAPDKLAADSDVFLRVLATGITTMESRSSAGVPGNGGSIEPAVSADGRFLAFQSAATNLVPGDANLRPDVFRRDRQSTETIRVSVFTGGAQSAPGEGSFTPTISGDGNLVVFGSETDFDGQGNAGLFLHNVTTNTTTRVSTDSAGITANSFSDVPRISADGAFVAFTSDGTNLVPNDTNGVTDVFRKNLATGQTTRVSVASGGAQADGPSNSDIPPFRCLDISDDGRFVVFESEATNLVPNDTNGQRDIFVHDSQSGQTTRVSLSTDGGQGDGPSFRPRISGDGRFVVFQSDADNLDADDTNGRSDVFVHDLQTGETRLLSRSLINPPASGNDNSFDPDISADSRVITFDSDATDLIEGDTNGLRDVFLILNPFPQ